MKKSQLKQLIKEVVVELNKLLLKEQYQTTITDPETGEEVDVDVEYDYSPMSYGHRQGMSRFAEPDEAAQVEIKSITTADGKEIDIDDIDADTLEKIEMAIQDQHDEMYEEVSPIDNTNELRYLIQPDVKDESMVRQFVDINNLNPVVLDIWNYGSKNLGIFPSKMVSLSGNRAGIKYMAKNNNQYIEIEVRPSGPIIYLFRNDQDMKPQLVKSGKFSFKLFKDFFEWR